MSTFPSLPIALLLLPIALTRVGRADDLPPPVAVPGTIIEIEQTETRDSPGNPPAVWRKGRDAGLNELIKVSKLGPSADLGLPGPSVDASTLETLDPIKEAVVQASDLKTYNPTKDPATLIKVLDRQTFPVIQNGEVISSFTVAKRNGNWVAVSFGQPRLIRIAYKARVSAPLFPGPHNQPLLLPEKKAEYTIVRVTGLNRVFLSARGVSSRPGLGPSEIYLIPLFDSARLNLKAGTPTLARTVFAALANDAKALTGKPT